MNANDQRSKQIQQQTADALGDWLYSNVTGGSGGGWTDDRKFFVVGYKTMDKIKQVREYYWTLCRPDRPDLEKPNRWLNFEDGGFMMSENPRFFYRNGPPMHVVHVTPERTISVFAFPSSNDDTLNLSITYDTR
ncbi:hypothetical protein IH992_16435 [Candidatus Poribacteria bacterium]|nr:hypothetical protein [Candidatus Poribacteria bacterium]